MSRIAKKPIELPKGVEFSMNGREVSAKGPKGSLTVTLHDAVELTQEENVLTFSPRDSRQSSLAVTGTMRSVVNNIIEGVANGFEKKLQLIGVGYRAQAQGKQLNLSLGLSQPRTTISVAAGVSRSRPRLPPRSWCAVATSNKWVRFARKFARTGLRSLTRARVLNTLTR